MNQNEQQQNDVPFQEQKQQDVNQMEPTPLSPPPSHKKLIIGIVVVFVLVAGIAGAYFLFQNFSPIGELTSDKEQLIHPNGEEATLSVTSVDTSSWKTYRNEEYGFEFQYPLGGTIDSKNNSRIVISGLHFGETEGSLGKIVVAVYENPLGLTTEEFFDGLNNTNYFSDASEFLDITLDDYPAIMFLGVIGLTSSDTVIVPIPGFYVEITTISGENLFDQFLSTFKFIEQKSTNATSEPEDTQTEISINSNVNKIKNNIVEKARQLLIAIDELSNTSTTEDVEEYVLPPLQSRPFIYYCEDTFILQYIGGEYHKLEYYSSASFRKTDECEATWYIGGEPSPASCSVTDECIPVRDFLYPLTLQTDKSSYKYGDKITVTLASNENRNETVELEDLGGNYCAGISLERIGKSSNDWIQDYIELPGSHDIRDCPYRITVSPDSPYKVIIRIDDTSTVPSGKWRVVHESEFASLTEGFWLAP